MSCNKQQAEDYRDSKPSPNNLVIDKIEFPNPFEDEVILNWGDRSKKDITGKYFSKNKDGLPVWHQERNYTNNDIPERIRDCNLENLKGIVIHETASNNSPANISFKKDGKEAGAHFLISKEGAIVQFNDVMELTNHGNFLNKYTVGIEFAFDFQKLYFKNDTKTFDDDKHSIVSFATWQEKPNKPIKNPLTTTCVKKIIRSKDGKLVDKWVCNPSYKRRADPKLKMLESDFKLTLWLCKVMILSRGLANEGTPKKYNINEIPQKLNEVKNLPLEDPNTFYNFSYNINFLQEKKSNNSSGELSIDWLVIFESDYKGKVPDKRKKDAWNTDAYDFFTDPINSKIGIIGHCAYHRWKSCGSFMSLYIWCRLFFVDRTGINNPEKAFKEAKNIFETHHYVNTLNTKVGMKKIEKRYKYLPVYRKNPSLVTDNNEISYEIYFTKNLATVFMRFKKDDKKKFLLLKRAHNNKGKTKHNKLEWFSPGDSTSREIKESIKHFFNNYEHLIEELPNHEDGKNWENIPNWLITFKELTNG